MFEQTLDAHSIPAEGSLKEAVPLSDGVKTCKDTKNNRQNHVVKKVIPCDINKTNGYNRRDSIFHRNCPRRSRKSKCQWASPSQYN